MRILRHPLLFAAAFLGFSGVVLGALGAHPPKGMFPADGPPASWETAVVFQMIHAVVILLIAIPGLPKALPRWVGYTLFAGVLAFSGSIYALALGAPSWVGPITPLGGLLFLLGWSGLALRAFRD